MNIDRARQILRSDETINVLLDGSPVWIESVDKSGLAGGIKSIRGQA